MNGLWRCAALVVGSIGSPLCGADSLPHAFQSGLAVGQIGKSARSPIRFDAVEHRIVIGAFVAPKEGDEITAPDGTVRTWASIRAEATEGGATFSGEPLSGGYVYTTFESDADRIAMLVARGHSMVYVNGAPRVGDPYSYGWLRIPVAIRKGMNEFLFACGRGSLDARLEACPTDGPFFLGADDTLPDLVVGEDNDLPLGVVVVVPAASGLAGATLEARLPDGTVVAEPLPPLLGETPSKIAGRIVLRPESVGPVSIDLHLKAGNETIAQRTVQLAAVAPEDRRRVTYRSAIDGSVQYYACVPASGATHETAGEDGLILSLHGASVEATSQAASYQPKDWATIVCPTNRRPFGFDWEDWGRIDALEALDDATRRFRPDPLRRWLTGHSMGGHGTWQLGSHFPDRFAAVAPSAGWISFASYGGVALSKEGVEGMFARATSASDTLALRDNLAQFGIYILHGDADDNVPVGQARQMRAVLGGGAGGFHADFAYHERKGANHWWGSECVDWPPLMQFLKERSLVSSDGVDRIEFATAAPGVSASCHWLRVEQQSTPWSTTSVKISLDRTKRTIGGSTSNAALLRLAPPLEPGPIAITLDNTTIETTLDGSPLWLAREGASWKVGAAPGAASKRPERMGAFKDGLRNDLVIVYGTGGDDASDAALRGKARFDAETFWYRGNGSIDIVADTAFDLGAFPNRGVLLLGNANTNLAWEPLLGRCPVLVRNGSIKVGDQELAGDDLVCTFVYPRPDSEIACVAVVAGTGPAGERLSMRLPYFVSGVGFPDLSVIGASSLLSGAAGFRAAGFFGNDWSVEHGEWTVAPTP